MRWLLSSEALRSERDFCAGAVPSSSRTQQSYKSPRRTIGIAGSRALARSSLAKEAHMSMRKETWFALMVAAATITGTFVLGTNGAQAASCTPSNFTDCTATCGTAGIASCSRDGSSVSCVCNETTKDVNGNAYGTATQDTASGTGNLSDQPPPDDYTQDCTGNKGQCKK